MSNRKKFSEFPLNFLYVKIKMKCQIWKYGGETEIRKGKNCSSFRFCHFWSFSSCSYVIRYAIWYYLHNLKNVKNTHGGVLTLVLKLTLLHGWFSRFLNCTNGIKWRNTPHIGKIRAFQTSTRIWAEIADHQLQMIWYFICAEHQYFFINICLIFFQNFIYQKYKTWYRKNFLSI